MKVILIESMPKLGKIGDIVDVKNGYGKNFLIPNKKAICYNQESYKAFEEKKHQFEAQSKNKLDIANRVKSALDGKNVIIIENASDDGRLYGSVNSSLISNKINDLIGEKIVEKSIIFLNKPIKEVGIYEAKLALHNELSINVKLVVSRTDSEANTLLNPPKKSKKESLEDENNVEVENSPKEKSNKKPRKKTSE